MSVRWVERVAVALAAAALVAACADDPESEPPATVGSVPVEAEQGTLLPVLPDTAPPDVTTTLPPGVLFGGDLCTALVASDFTRVTFAGSGSGRLVDFFPAAEDACQYVVQAGGDEYSVVVGARSAVDFERPAGTDVDVEVLSGIGEQALGIDRGDRYEVLVQVPNGYFTVSAPDSASAQFLAGRAVTRARPS